MRAHDPSRNAARYLAGMMSGRARRGFEQHIIGCEECWHEVEVGRRGRALAESARELAPQRLREMVRSSVAATSPSKTRMASGARLGALTAAVALAVAVVFIVLQPAQPQEIETILSDYRGAERLYQQAPRALPATLGDLQLVEVRGGRVGDMSLEVHEYADRAGHIVRVYQSDTPFPVAEGAKHSAAGATWSATLDGVVLFCADHPVPSLVVGDDRAEVRLAADELGLK
ncbi:MAG: hypothetical protein ACRDK3_13340 [Actinomycetota bacterium]